MDTALQQFDLDAEWNTSLDGELSAAVSRARDAVLAQQHSEGYWCYELEADCTIPAEYILMMHAMDEIDAELEAKMATYLRAHQDADDGWPLYYGGEFDLSCSIKAYYALKLAGDDPDAAHMVRARHAILAAGGAAHANVFTRIALALFNELPWRGVPFIPVEIMLLPQWFPFHLSKVSYWSRAVMVPLFILCSLKPRAKNPRDVHMRELFVTPPEDERRYFRAHTPLSRVFFTLDRLGRRLEPFIPNRIRGYALKKAEDWIIERLNGEDGLGAIFPAMVNAYEALVIRGYSTDHPYCVKARDALRKLVVERQESAYCQPCVSPVWDTGLAALALQAEGSGESAEPRQRALDWLASCQVQDAPGDWRHRRPRLKGGGWAFQFANPHYPDLDDTAVVAWALHQSAEPQRYQGVLVRAADWLSGMQSRDGGFAAFDVDNTYDYLNEIPFADHGALLDQPTSDVSARVLAYLSRLNRPSDRAARERCLAFLKREQEPDGPWFGRWGTNYIYGTWSVLSALEQAGVSYQQPWVQHAIVWLKQVQKRDGGWGEGNGTYFNSSRRGQAPESTSFHTAWALLGLMAAGEVDSDAVRRGVDYLIRTQRADGGWYDPEFTAPGFPRVFYLKYHGYSVYFPLWALARYRRID